MYLLKWRSYTYPQAMRRVRLRVKEIALEKGVSMTKLHIRSEVSFSTIRRIFREPHTEITLTTLGKLAKALGVPSSELIEDVEDEEE